MWRGYGQGYVRPVRIHNWWHAGKIDQAGILYTSQAVSKAVQALIPCLDSGLFSLARCEPIVLARQLTDGSLSKESFDQELNKMV